MNRIKWLQSEISMVTKDLKGKMTPEQRDWVETYLDNLYEELENELENV